MFRILVCALLMASSAFSLNLIKDNVQVTKSLRADSSVSIGKKPTSSNPKTFAVWDSANDTLKSYPIDSIVSDSVGKAHEADTATRVPRQDSCRSSHISDTATNVPRQDSSRVSDLSHKAHTTAATAADTNLLAASATDSSFKKLTRAQLRAAVDSVRRADSANGSARFGGVTKSRYDSLIFCDTPFIPKSVRSGSTKSYVKSIMRERNGYIDIPSTDTTFTAIGATDDYYVAMATDTNGNVYAVTESTGRLYKQTGGSGSFSLIKDTTFTFTDVCIRKSTNTVYVATYASLSYTRFYSFNGSDFVLYDSLPSSCGSYPGKIHITENDDMYAGICGYIYVKENCTGPFVSIGGDHGLSTAFTSIGDTVWAFDYGGHISWLIPGAGDFVDYDVTHRYYSGAWTDNSGNIYVAVSGGGPTSAGILRRLSNLSSFDFFYYGSIYGFDGGTFNNGTLYACVNSATGDIFTLNSSNEFLRAKLNVGGVTYQRGKLHLYSVDTSTSDSLLVLGSDNSVSVRDLSTAVAPPSDNKILRSTSAGRVDTSNIKNTHNSTVSHTEFGDSNNTAQVQFIGAGGNATDQDKDSALVIIHAGGDNTKARGGTITLGGNETSIRGGIQFSTGDSGVLLGITQGFQLRRSASTDSLTFYINQGSTVTGGINSRYYMITGDTSSSIAIGPFLHVDFVLSKHLASMPDTTRGNRFYANEYSRTGSATNYSVIDTTGYRAYGTAQAWDDVGSFKLSSFKTVAGAGNPVWNPMGNGFNAYQFADGDSAEGDEEIFHRFVNGDSVDLHVHYRTGSQDGTTRYVKFDVVAMLTNDNDSATYVLTGSLEDTIPANTKKLTNRIKAFGMYAVSNINIGAGCLFKIKRSTASGTAPSASPFVMRVGMHKRVNDLGSRNRYSK